MTQYAANTRVPVDRSRHEIETVLDRYGADAFGYASKGGRAMINFEAQGRHVRFVVDLPVRDDPEFNRTPTGKARSATASQEAYETAVRQRWRALALLVKAKLEAVESGIVTFEDEFLPHTMLPSGRTVAEELQPQIAQAYETGAVTSLQIEAGPR